MLAGTCIPTKTGKFHISAYKNRDFSNEIKKLIKNFIILKLFKKLGRLINIKQLIAELKGGDIA